jgi:hypothetical protein
MKIQIEATTKETKPDKNGKTYTGVKIQDGDWVNIHGDHRGKKGQMINITEPKQYGQSKWAEIEKPQPPEPVPSANNEKESIPEWERESRPLPPPAPPPTDKLTRPRTLQECFIILDMVSLHVKKLEPESPEARANLINNVMNKWLDGKII